MDQEILVVVSKLKQYIKNKGDMNTAGSVADVISNNIRKMCDDAMAKAKSQGRKTVMDRDFE